MTFLELSMVGLGGFLGAVVRYFVSMRMNRSGRIPVGTLTVNLVGAFLIGCVFGLDLSMMWTFFLASGLAGALTTFSTLNKELIELWRNGHKKKALVYVLVTYCGGIILALFGYYLGLYL
ncbi:fluoride efflux transporter CrcB [Sporosarcina sp. G11-34]|uniref:fluoride efflux transporter CrcB n=1 Tax=Sporosarcina sp. G11-34 TaxID=2849605 RepID=UPI0022A9CDAC|nr:fluoride efflux transporter CrcB [Sporosarcina sp. G11-34]MCZ2260727.1 fluoride efflux transporter CrcB [Sporosarcina sp. G11-34]